MKLQQFSDSAQLNEVFAQEIVLQLQQAIENRGQAWLVVSGGRTPQGLFSILSQTELDWSKVTITLADDRYLPESEQDSNERLVKASLLQGKAGAARFISLYAPATSAAEAVATVLPRFSDAPIFDVVILGMGEDGHTASLFPCSAELVAGLAADAPDVLAVTPTTAPYQRISLSKSRLLKSRAIYLHLTGESKLSVLTKAQADTDELSMPIRAFIHHTDPELSVMFAAK